MLQRDVPEPGVHMTLLVHLQAVLVNGATASTAEFLAAAIQDSHAGQLVGEHTFGKGRMQRVIPLSSGAALLLSNSAFMTPAHHRIDGVRPSGLGRCAAHSLLVVPGPASAGCRTTCSRSCVAPPAVRADVVCTLMSGHEAQATSARPCPAMMPSD